MCALSRAFARFGTNVVMSRFVPNVAKTARFRDIRHECRGGVVSRFVRNVAKAARFRDIRHE
jgi:hypothetical protein